VPGTRFIATYFFETNVGPAAGWTENYYLTASSLAAALGVAAGNSAVIPRLFLLHPDYSLVDIRVSDIDVLRDSFVAGPLSGAGKGQFQTTSGGIPESEAPYEALLIRFSSGGVARRNFLLRGLPEGVVSKTRAYNPSSQWVTNFDLWKNSVLAPVGGGPPNPNTWAVRQRVLGAPATPTGIIVGSDLRSISLLFAAVPVGTTVGGFILVNGVTGAGHINKIWRVKGATATGILTFPGQHNIYGVPVVTFSEAKAITYNLVPITDALPRRGVKKDTGRPFDLLRGKSRGLAQ
jgi:hypothetical protein